MLLSFLLSLLLLLLLLLLTASAEDLGLTILAAANLELMGGAFPEDLCGFESGLNMFKFCL